jgi:hypothetical protein
MSRAPQSRVPAARPVRMPAALRARRPVRVAAIRMSKAASAWITIVLGSGKVRRASAYAARCEAEP